MNSKCSISTVVGAAAVAVTFHLLPVAACGGEEKGLQLSLSMVKNEWAEGEDVRLKVELRNPTIVPVELNTAARKGELYSPAKIEFSFGTEQKIDRKTYGVSTVELATLFAGGTRDQSVVLLPPRSTVSWSLNLSSCGVFLYRFPRGIILGPSARRLGISPGRFAPGHEDLTEVVSLDGEYQIRAALVLAAADGRKFGARTESNTVAWRMIAPGKELKRLSIDPKNQWQVIVLAPDKDSAMHGHRGIRLVYWRKGSPGDPHQADSWGWGHIPYTVLETVDAVPSALLGSWFAAPPQAETQELPTDLKGSVEWWNCRMDKVCGRCWVIYQAGAATQLAMLASAAKAGPIQLEQGKTLTALSGNGAGTAVVLFRTGKDDATLWSCKVVKITRNDGIDMSRSRALPRLKGHREVKLQKKDGGIAAVSAADASVSEPLIPRKLWSPADKLSVLR